MIACLSVFFARLFDRAFSRSINRKIQPIGQVRSAWLLHPPRAAALRRLVACLLVTQLAAGCAWVERRGTYDGYAAEPLAGTKLDNLRKALTEPSTAPLVSPKCFDPTPSIQNCAIQRNQAISFLMAESSNLCVQHIKSIYGNEAAFNIATGSIAVLASGWATLSSGGPAKALSALSTFASAERSLVNETIYKSMLTTAIGTKIEEARATKGKALLLRKKDSYDDYRIEDALYDVIDYHESCSFYYGLQKALKEGTQATPEAKRLQLEAQRQNLEQQLLAYSEKLDPKSKGIPAASEDPLLGSMLRRYRALDREIEALSSLPVASKQEPQKASSGTTANQAGKPAAKAPKAKP